MEETIAIRHYNRRGDIESISIYKSPVICPHCKLTMIPEYIFLDADNYARNEYSVFCRCTNPKCNQSFIAQYYNNNGGILYEGLKQNYSLNKHNFSDIIEGVSHSFCDIYNQAYAAKQLNLTQICGVGYRKALEFLIKDYVISKDSSKTESIKSKLLANCINEDVTDERIKQVSRRATWIGNDETHYVRKWEDKDVNDLVALIDLTIRWIESEKETEKLLESMPERK